MQAAQPISKDLVFVGGGHTHAIVLRKFAMQPLAGVRLTLITNLVDTPYSGMLPCHISGLYDFDEAHIDLRPLTRFAHCRLLMDRAIAIDTVNQRVICAQHPPVAYDLLSLDTGSTPAAIAVPGAAEYAIPAKPVPDLLQAWDRLLWEVQQDPKLPRAIAIVGGGVGGVELSLNMQTRLWTLLDDLKQPRDRITFHLFHRGAEIANGRNRSTRRLLRRRFLERGVQVHTEETVIAVEAIAAHRYQVRCESGLTVACDRVFWVTNAAAPAWVRESGLATDEAGFVLVEDTLQSCSHPNIFAAGDVATMRNHPRPKAGVFAVRQGPPLFHNLQAMLLGNPLRPFHPQRQYLNIIDTGHGNAIASRGPFTLESPLMRAWKDRIDRKFMALFSDFPSQGEGQMQAPVPIPAAAADRPKHYCAGCGSKVGRDALNRALQRVRQDFPLGIRHDGSDTVLVGLDSPDDAAIAQVPAGMLTVHTVDFFREIVDDPFVFAQICVKHCLSDVYAMGAEPYHVLAIATVPYATPAKQEDTLFHLLAGTQKALLGTPAPLVGGHTTEGPELALGFACTGIVPPDRILRKGGMEPGQTLIVTQPIGTGTLFAADMQRRARGRWIEAAIAHMIQPSAPAARCLQQHGVTACTDVTGFGLLGHLLEMVDASQVAVALDLRELPVLPGARDTLRQGIVSSLHSQNQTAATALSNGSAYAGHPDYGLLFDPQTAGGLLATVPSDRAADCLTALQNLGYIAAAIGTILPRAQAEPPITIKQW